MIRTLAASACDMHEQFVIELRKQQTILQQDIDASKSSEAQLKKMQEDLKKLEDKEEKKKAAVASKQKELEEANKALRDLRAEVAMLKTKIDVLSTKVKKEPQASEEAALFTPNRVWQNVLSWDHTKRSEHLQRCVGAAAIEGSLDLGSTLKTFAAQATGTTQEHVKKLIELEEENAKLKLAQRQSEAALQELRA